MRELLLGRIKEIRKSEKDFGGEEWDAVHVGHTHTETNEYVNRHIRDVDFDEVNDLHLFKIFEFIILTRNNIMEERIGNTYRNFNDLKIK